MKTNETAKRTPGPWKAKKKFCAYRFFAPHNQLIPIEHPGSGYVAYVSARNFNDESQANAAFIVEACNNYERVLAQRDELAAALRHEQWCRSCCEDGCQSCFDCKADSLLAKLETK